MNSISTNDALFLSPPLRHIHISSASSSASSSFFSTLFLFFASEPPDLEPPGNLEVNVAPESDIQKLQASESTWSALEFDRSEKAR